MHDFYIIRIFVLTALAFIFTVAWTPLFTHFLYKHKLGKRIRSAGDTPIYTKMHAHKTGTPTMGGILIWLTVFVFSVSFFYLAKFFPESVFGKISFLNRAETLLPLGALMASATIGLFDDWLDVRGTGVRGGGGLSMIHRLLIYTFIAVIGALWFYYKLGWDIFHIPFLGDYTLGFSYILIFIIVIVATSFSVNETDGLDGLAGGVLLFSFASYAVISFSQGKYELATFCGVIVGALLAFLWFNVIPARFYMGDTGSMSLGVTLGVIAMLTNTALILPIIGFVLVLESVSVILQLSSKRLRNGKKIFLSAPIHHHFEAMGWAEPKIVFRFWIVSGISAVLGIIIFLLDHTM